MATPQWASTSPVENSIQISITLNDTTFCMLHQNNADDLFLSSKGFKTLSRKKILNTNSIGKAPSTGKRCNIQETLMPHFLPLGLKANVTAWGKTLLLLWGLLCLFNLKTALRRGPKYQDDTRLPLLRRSLEAAKGRGKAIARNWQTARKAWGPFQPKGCKNLTESPAKGPQTPLHPGGTGAMVKASSAKQLSVDSKIIKALQRLAASVHHFQQLFWKQNHGFLPMAACNSPEKLLLHTHQPSSKMPNCKCAKWPGLSKGPLLTYSLNVGTQK